MAKCKNEDIALYKAKKWVDWNWRNDKKKGMFDSTKFIDVDFCVDLVKKSNVCHYCKCDIQYREYNKTLGTLERLDNTFGHNKDNVVICCRTCNYGKRSNRDVRILNNQINELKLIVKQQQETIEQQQVVNQVWFNLFNMKKSSP